MNKTLKLAILVLVCAGIIGIIVGFSTKDKEPILTENITAESFTGNLTLIREMEEAEILHKERLFDYCQSKCERGTFVENGFYNITSYDFNEDGDIDLSEEKYMDLELKVINKCVWECFEDGY